MAAAHSRGCVGGEGIDELCMWLGFHHKELKESWGKKRKGGEQSQGDDGQGRGQCPGWVTRQPGPPPEVPAQIPAALNGKSEGEQPRGT